MRDWLIKYWMGVVFGAFTGAVSGAVAHLWKKQKAQQEQQGAMKDGMLALMHDRIFAIYAECQKKGYATVEDLRNLEYLYKPYHKLGGNGTGTELYERIKKMPTELVGE
ncbi:MAG: hypothetical protein KID04_17180 [Clostridium sp.]|nr:hypothetical protein [Clostridium sp.]